MTTLSQRLSLLRKERGYTQEWTAGQVQLSLRAYQNYERGDREPVAGTLLTLADFYGVSVDYLLGRTENREVNR